MSLTLILTDGHLEFIGIGSLTPNALKDIYLLTSAADFRVVACDGGDNGRCLIYLSFFFIYICKSQELLHARRTRTSHSDFYV